MSETSVFTLVIDGNASGAVAAAEATAKSLQGLGPAGAQAQGSLANIGNGSQSAASALAQAGLQIDATGGSLRAVPAAAGATGNALQAVGGSSHAAAAGMTAAGSAAVSSGEGLGVFRDRASGMAAAALALNIALPAIRTDLGGLGSGAQDAAGAFASVATAMAAGFAIGNTAGAVIAGVGKTAIIVADEVSQLGSHFDRALGPMNAMSSAAGGSQGSLSSLAAAIKAADEAAAGSGSKYDQWQSALNKANSSASELGGGIQGMAAKVAAAGDAQAKFASATESISGAMKKAGGSVIEFSSDNDKIAQVMANVVQFLGQGADAARRYGSELGTAMGQSFNFGSLPSGSSSLGFGSNSGMFRAEGGPVSMGRAYMVGEEGPELFVPPSNGTIVPNDALGSPGGSAAYGGGYGAAGVTIINHYSVSVVVHGPVGITDLKREIHDSIRDLAQNQTGVRGYLANW
jgi:hypothetical protein